MDYFEIDKGRCNRLQIAHGVLPSFIDRLVELDDLEPEVELEPFIDIDRNQTSTDQGVQVFVLDSVLDSIG
jgi:hypothetical protein